MMMTMMILMTIPIMTIPRMTTPRMTMMMMIIGSEAMRQYTRQSGPTIETLTRFDFLNIYLKSSFLPFFLSTCFT